MVILREKFPKWITFYCFQISITLIMRGKVVVLGKLLIYIRSRCRKSENLLLSI